MNDTGFGVRVSQMLECLMRVQACTTFDAGHESANFIIEWSRLRFRLAPASSAQERKSSRLNSVLQQMSKRMDGLWHALRNC